MASIHTLRGFALNRISLLVFIIVGIALLIILENNNEYTRLSIFTPKHSIQTSPQQPSFPARKFWSKQKVFIDCGANTGSSYKLFHEIWPNPEEYWMVSFEIDPNLKPYYAGFENHTAFVPMGVSSTESTFTAYLENAWTPQVDTDPDFTVKEKGMKWGGGSLFTFGTQEKPDFRRWKRHINVPTFDLSKYIKDNFREEDEVILKIDIEGAEYDVIDKMLNDSTFSLVDYFFLEFHDGQPTGWTQTQMNNLRTRMVQAGVSYSKWEAEHPIVPDASKWKPPIMNNIQPNIAFCDFKNGKVKLAIAVGMNKRKAKRLIATVLAHNSTKGINVALFMYRDFMYDNPELISDWLKDPRVVIGVRGDSPMPEAYYKKFTLNHVIEMAIISTLRQVVRSTGFSTQYFLYDFTPNSNLMKAVEKFGLKSPQSPVWVPPKDPNDIGSPFFTKRSVEKTPPLLHYLYSKLINYKNGSTIVLDADFDETWIGSGFLLDYLASPHARASSLKLISFHQC